MINRIEYVRHNFKTGDGKRVTLGDPAVAVLGPNGAGKTALRAAIECAVGAPVKYLADHVDGEVDVALELTTGTISASGKPSRVLRTPSDGLLSPRLLPAVVDLETWNADSTRKWLLANFADALEVDLQLPPDASPTAVAAWLEVINPEGADTTPGGLRLLEALGTFSKRKTALSGEINAVTAQVEALRENGGAPPKVADATRALFGAIAVERAQGREAVATAIQNMLAEPRLTRGHEFCAMIEEWAASRPDGTADCPVCATKAIEPDAVLTRIRKLREKHPHAGLTAAARRALETLERVLAAEPEPDPKALPMTVAIDRLVTSAKSRQIADSVERLELKLIELQRERTEAAALATLAQAKTDELLTVVGERAVDQIRAHLPEDLAVRFALDLTGGGCRFTLGGHPLHVASTGERTLIARAAACALLDPDKPAIMLLDDADVAALSAANERILLAHLAEMAADPEGSGLHQVIVFRQDDRADALSSAYRKVRL